MTRADILAVLEQHAGIVDDAAERETLATALHEAMLADPDAVVVFDAFHACAHDRDAMSAQLVDDVLAAAWRLAGGA